MAAFSKQLPNRKIQVQAEKNSTILVQATTFIFVIRSTLTVPTRTHVAKKNLTATLST